MEGNVGVGCESLRAPRMERDNGFATTQGQPAKGAFPKEMPSLLLGLSAKMNLDGDAPENQFLSSDLIFLLNSLNAGPDHDGATTNEKGREFPDLSLVP